MNVAYKHLESRLRIAELTVAQWAGVLCGVLLALGWGMYLSPLSPYPTLISAIYLAGLPAGAAFLAGLSDFDLWLHVRAAIAHRRAAGRYTPGPGRAARGYLVAADPTDDDTGALGAPVDLDVEELWRS
jgi:hypothetical protein